MSAPALIVRLGTISAREPLQIVTVTRRCHFAPVQFSAAPIPSRAHGNAAVTKPTGDSRVHVAERSQPGNDLSDQYSKLNSVFHKESL